jgi:hypothetical protein
VRRIVLAAALTVVWVSAVLLLSAGFVPQLDGSETELSIRITFLILGGLVATLPVVVVWLPHRRLVTQLVQAVLAVEVPRPQVPPVSAWAGPQPVFQRLRWTAYTLVLIPLLTLLLSAANYWMYLDEDAAATVALVFSAVPLAFLVVTMTTPRRIVRGVQAGIDAGQVVPVRVPRRADRIPLLGSAQQSWFEARLADGQSVVLRTPVRFAAEARGPGRGPRGSSGRADRAVPAAGRRVAARPGAPGASAPGRPQGLRGGRRLGLQHRRVGAGELDLVGVVGGAEDRNRLVCADGVDPGLVGRQPVGEVADVAGHHDVELGHAARVVGPQDDEGASVGLLERRHVPHGLAVDADLSAQLRVLRGVELQLAAQPGAVTRPAGQ